MTIKLLILMFFMLLGIIILKAQPDSSTSDEPSPYEYLCLDKQPREINLKEIQKEIGWPGGDICIEGTWVYRILIDEKGNYIRHLPPKNPFPIICKLIEKHIDKLIFTPGIINEQPVKCWVNVPFVFKLR